MPLKSGSSQAAISANIKIERNAGKPERQAVAIAESKARGDAAGRNGGKPGSYEDNQNNPYVKKAYEQGRNAPRGRANPFESGQRMFHEAWARGYAGSHDCEVEMDADVDMDESPTAAQIEAAIAAGEKELEHQRKALTSLRKGMDSARRLAFDRRMETIDGHLVVTGCHITKANVCPYLGAEIPNSEALGLKADKIYLLYRDAAEIQSARDTYNRVPLLMQHVAVSADAPQQFLTVGTASNARFTHPYLDADLTIWTREGIDAIESGAQRELSCGYRYVADMTPGTSPEGEKYDGRMTQIIANHIALVEAGRAGPDVMVADAVLQSRIRLP